MIPASEVWLVVSRAMTMRKQGLSNTPAIEKYGDMMMALTAILHKEEDMYVAECPEVGTVSQGRTIEEAIENLKEATELYLEEFPL
jgi:hypothetical protein